MNAQPWLITHLINTGVMTETGLTRRARLRHCPTCGAYVIAGLDGDVCAMEAVCDPRPLTARGEAFAWCSPLRTWELWQTRGRLELEPRTFREVRRRPAGTGGCCDVLAEHACGHTLPPGSYGASVFAPSTPAPPAGTTPPF